MKQALLLPTIFVFFLVFTSCEKDSENNDYAAQNKQEILDYIESNNLNAQSTDSGLYYVINELGTGAQVTENSNVTVIYRGYFTNGTTFDQSSDQGATFDLQNTIEGFKEGLSLFKEGGKGVLLIPSHLGYGSENQSSIPAGSVLIFNIRILSVN